MHHGRDRPKQFLSRLCLPTFIDRPRAPLSSRNEFMQCSLASWTGEIISIMPCFTPWPRKSYISVYTYRQLRPLIFLFNIYHFPQLGIMIDPLNVVYAVMFALFFFLSFCAICCVYEVRKKHVAAFGTPTEQTQLNFSDTTQGRFAQRLCSHWLLLS
jgi:hypothetical protein